MAEAAVIAAFEHASYHATAHTVQVKRKLMEYRHRLFPFSGREETYLARGTLQHERVGTHLQLPAGIRGKPEHHLSLHIAEHCFAVRQTAPCQRSPVHPARSAQVQQFVFLYRRINPVLRYPNGMVLFASIYSGHVLHARITEGGGQVFRCRAERICHPPVQAERGAVHFPFRIPIRIWIGSVGHVVKQSEIIPTTLLVEHHVPAVRSVAVAAHQHDVFGTRKPHRPIYIQQQVGKLLAAARTPFHRLRPDMRTGLELSGKIYRNLAQRVEQRFRHKARVLRFGQLTYAVQQRVIPLVNLFTPRYKPFVTHPVRQDVFTEQAERHVLAPRLLTPHLECPLDVLYQVLGRDAHVTCLPQAGNVQPAVSASDRVQHCRRRVPAGGVQLVQFQLRVH